MASIDSGGGGKGGKKPVDQEIPLIPFIDLLLCCVMFLLATAVWNQLAALNANQQVPGQAATEDAPPEDEKVKLILQVRNAGYVLASTAGESIEIKKIGSSDQREYDVDELKKKLGEWKQAWEERDDLIIAPEDGVVYEDVVHAMDAASGAGFSKLSMSDAAAML
ncbi:MAG: biopolymer transporter ExbD [Polyangiales bacterium]